MVDEMSSLQNNLGTGLISSKVHMNNFWCDLDINNIQVPKENGHKNLKQNNSHNIW